MSGAAPSLSRLGALARRTAESQERCDLCGAAIAPEHRHLLDVSKREPTLEDAYVALVTAA